MEKPEQIMVAIMAGAELGFAPFQSLQSFAVVNGRPTLWGDGLVAVVRRNGCTIREWHEDDTAFCEVKRPDTGETILRSFSQADAAKAGLAGKTGPWQQYPQRMRAMRARAWAVRDGCADMLRGFQVAEEVQDYQPMTVRGVPAERPNLAARLAAPKEDDAPREGFSAVHGLSDDDHMPDFDADTPSDAASNKPASDPASDQSDAGDPFPGDLPPAEDTKASGAEADADEGTSLAVDTIAWADRLIADLPFLRPEQIEALETDRKELAKFAVLKATDMTKARELEAAITAAKEG
ncbi:MAG: hypothetical protein BGO02_01550 [Brevundimonas sp. 67-6]|nr:MAG: hypothetical protein BGO02_01550 [Brevundimonas sp. 67-6]